MQVRRRGWMCRCRIAALAALALLPLSPGAAEAGAWTQPKGEGLGIVTGLYTEAARAFDGDGKSARIRDAGKAALFGYLEYGVRDWLTAVAETELKSFSADGPLRLDETRFGSQAAGARVRLWQGGRSVVSAELLGRVEGGQEDFFSIERGGAVDLRLLAGTSFDVGAWSSFADGGATYRPQFGKDSDLYRFDLTLGTRPSPKVLLLAQSFNEMEMGEGFAVSRREHKAELSLVYDLTPAIAVQVGALATVAGENALAERGVITALWFRF